MLWLVKQYSHLYGVVKDRTGRNLRGLGFLLRRVRTDETLIVMNRLVWMNHEVAQCYGRLVVGSWNEPETHTFLNFVFDRLHHASAFVDVGANVGEMVIDLAGHPQVARSYAFEPIPACAWAIRKSIELNGFADVTVFESLCGDEIGSVSYSVSSDVSDSSLHSVISRAETSTMTITTLDASIDEVRGNLVILADVEGYEVNVLRGGRRLIDAHRPMIIFEYNHVSKAHFTAADIQATLGDGYTIWRLRRDARLDSQIETAWNCVAIPRSSVFESLVADLKAPS